MATYTDIQTNHAEVPAPAPRSLLPADVLTAPSEVHGLWSAVCHAHGTPLSRMLARIKTRKTPINIDNVTVARMFYPLRVYAMVYSPPHSLIIVILILIRNFSFLLSRSINHQPPG